jgi:hypothetical protein
MALVVTVALLVGIAQLVLPGLAEQRVRDELEGFAAVSEVKVDSTPAVKLLFGEVDSLTARLRDAESTQGAVADLIARTEKIDRLRIDADNAEITGVGLTDVSLVKDGSAMRAAATLSRAELESVLPAGAEVGSISSEGGALLVDGSFDVLGFRLSGPARVEPTGGAIVLRSEQGLLAGLAQLTLFQDDRVRVTALEGEDAGDRLRLGARGRVGSG